MIIEGGVTGLQRLPILKNLLITGSILLILFMRIGGAEEVNMADAPNVPPDIFRIMPEVVVIKFDAKEFVGTLGDGKDYKFWSFHGTVPGPMIRVRLGDTVEFHLSNDSSNHFPHNLSLIHI